MTSRIDSYHQARSRTPFASEARSNPMAALKMRICIAHGILDEYRDTLTVDESLFKQLLKQSLAPAIYEQVLQELESIETTFDASMLDNPRLAQYSPSLDIGDDESVIYSKSTKKK